jgi:DNA invertase Pin-like site-specific DNA recombinase
MGHLHLVQGAAVSSRLRLAYGYICVGDSPAERVEKQRAALGDLASKFGLLLDTVFIDYQLRLVANRPAFRTLLDVVRQLRPYGVLVPSGWHLSARPVERVALLEQFASLGCSVLAAHQGKASVLVTGQAAGEPVESDELPRQESDSRET